MNDIDGAAIGLMGVGMISLQNGMYQMTDYQRQELNLLRRHQGLPPIAPNPYPRDFFWEIIVMGIRAFIAIYFVFAPLVVFLDPSIAFFVAIPAGITFFCVMTQRRNAKFVRQYRRQLQEWVAVGCP